VEKKILPQSFASWCIDESKFGKATCWEESFIKEKFLKEE